jgi:hypothetical protein
MVALLQSNAAKGVTPVPVPKDAGGIVAKRYKHTLSANPTAGDILEMAPLPSNLRVIDMVLDSDDLDTNGSPTIAMDVGIMSGNWGVNDNTRTCGAEFFSGSNVGQAGTVARPTLKTAFRTTQTENDRSIGIKFTTASATFASGEIGLTVTYAAD